MSAVAGVSRLEPCAGNRHRDLGPEPTPELDRIAATQGILVVHLAEPNGVLRERLLVFYAKPVKFRKHESTEEVPPS